MKTCECPVRKISGEVFCNESEDIEKVKKAFMFLFEKNEIIQQSQPGVFGTTIRILRAENKNKKRINEVVELMRDSLSVTERNKIVSESDIRMNEDGKFYLRFDKQKAFKEKLKISEESEDSIQLILCLKGYPSTKEKFLDSLNKIFG